MHRETRTWELLVPAEFIFRLAPNKVANGLTLRKMLTCEAHMPALLQAGHLSYREKETIPAEGTHGQQDAEVAGLSFTLSEPYRPPTKESQDHSGERKDALVVSTAGGDCQWCSNVNEL